MNHDEGGGTASLQYGVSNDGEVNCLTSITVLCCVVGSLFIEIIKIFFKNKNHYESRWRWGTASLQYGVSNDGEVNCLTSITVLFCVVGSLFIEIIKIFFKNKNHYESRWRWGTASLQYGVSNDGEVNYLTSITVLFCVVGSLFIEIIKIFFKNKNHFSAKFDKMFQNSTQNLKLIKLKFWYDIEWCLQSKHIIWYKNNS